ncbi:hypothetical protein N0V95_004059 [Ascochyta clinopodiicola]|nr:hypothetical protein N0V95_004059 [Ascochyta clinopodiicola]
MGRLATIAFAHRLGTSLEPECKTYRLAADIFNDTAMVLDCLSPAFPKPARVAVLSFSSCLRALCGVCAGSAKASLSAHFAKRGNLGELNAKDSSQETVISLLGMLVGSLVVSWVHSPMATWATLMGLLAVHLGTNYAAVKAVRMTSLNRQRANIVFGTLLQQGKVLSPKEVSDTERVFERDGVLRWVDDGIAGYGRIGVSLQVLLSRLGTRHDRTGSMTLETVKVPELLDVYAAEGYLLWYAELHSEALIVLKKDCTVVDQLRAWTHALLLAQRRRDGSASLDMSVSGRLTELRLTLAETQRVFGQYVGPLQDKGWDLSVAALETRAGVRAVIDTKEDQ